MKNAVWSDLTATQVNRCAKEEVERALSKQGCHASNANRPYNFTVRTPGGFQFNIVVRSFRVEKKTSYTFIEKRSFNPDPALFLAVVRFEDGHAPDLFLIASSLNGAPNPLFEERNYTDQQKSAPEWGLTLSTTMMTILSKEYRLRQVLAELCR
jgi:hypothetical protein